MRIFRNFYIYFVVIILAGIPALVVVDFLCLHKDPETAFLLKTLDSQPVDALYFGDSTIRFYGNRDKDISGIDLLFQKYTGLRVCTVAHPGFSPILYTEYLNLLSKTRYKPKLVIVPINLRSFTGSSNRRPALSFPLKQIYIRYKASGTIELLDYLNFRFLGKEENLTAQWKKQPVGYEGIYLWTPQMIQDETRIPEDLDYRPEREYLYSKELGIKFRYHYMAPVTENDAMFSYIDDMLKKLDNLGVPVFFYITPINCLDGEKYAGTSFLARNLETRAIIKRFMDKRKVPCLDLAQLLTPDFFIHKRDVFEHLNDKGRAAVARSVAQAVQTRYFRKAE